MDNKVRIAGNPICKRTYMELSLKMSSPLLIGTGENEYTNMDILVDEIGQAILPASSIAGALRQYIKAVYITDKKGEEIANALFGEDRDFGMEQGLPNRGHQSRLFIYDTILHSAVISRRDGIRLDEFKTTDDKAKYDMQIVEAGTKCKMYLELRERESDCQGEGDQSQLLGYLMDAIAALSDGEITIGAKGNRGFGKICVDEVKMMQFNMKDKEEHFKWLDWNYREDDAFKNSGIWDLKLLASNREKRYNTLCVPLEIKNTIIIRDYVVDSPQNIDYKHLMSGKMPVITGTGWMGAIRSRIATIIYEILSKSQFNSSTELSMEACQQKIDSIFGTWITADTNTNNLVASLVKVEESTIKKGHELKTTRNAIDRFTGGVINGSLFTASPYIGGKTELMLRWSNTLREPLSSSICGLLLWALKDLQEGLLAVGGETGIGRGIFTGDKILLNGIEIQGTKELEPYYKAAIDWVIRKEGEEKLL